MLNLARISTDIGRYIYLANLQSRNEKLFYQIAIENIAQIMPLVYTPTVGKACQEFGHIYQRPQGMFISSDDKGHIAELLENWQEEDVRCIVVTDGERILGLGDLGLNGIGIPIGKLALYTACGGVNPDYCLPIVLDVGTNNQKLLDDPLYIGLKQKRIARAEYDEMVEEFVVAITRRYPKALLQFEDFGNQNAFRLLEKYRHEYCVFNDDIQGTGAVALAGLLAAARLSGTAFTEQKFLFLGAGEAGIGIADMIVAMMMQMGVSEETARARCWFVDSGGLVVKSRTNLAHHKLAYAHDHAGMPTLADAVEALKPTALVGVSGQPSTFTPAILRRMAEINASPIIFALSNPTSQAECTAESAYVHTDGHAIFASGSPFNPVEYNGRTYVPGQGNNVYIFPGIGLAVATCELTCVTDEMVLASAIALAGMTSPADLALGRCYPSLNKIRDCSLEVATAVAEVAYANGLARAPKPENIREHLRQAMYDGAY